MLTVSRRGFLLAAAAPVFGAAQLSSKQRVDRALKGSDVDHAPFSLWHHFGLEKQGPEKHAEATIQFHKRYSTDLVKVMSDFPYPKPAGSWYELKVEPNPFAPQVRALELIQQGVGGDAYFVETLFNPWNVAEKLSSAQEVKRLMAEKPQQLLNALEVIAKSEANHAKKAIALGASGVFLAIANAQDGILTREEYRKFSEPFDRIVLDSVKSARLNILHLHGDKVYLDHFYNGWPASAINYSAAGTGTSLAQARAKYAGMLMGGTDERVYRNRSVSELQGDYVAAKKAAGNRLIFAPGCSVPNESTPDELARMKAAVEKS